MKVSFLDGPTLVEKLPSLIAKSNNVDIAMAYVKKGGLRTLLKYFNKDVSKRKQIRIVFGLSTRQGITDKESAEYLLSYSKQKNFEVRKWNNSGFHPKLYIFHGKEPCVIVGSANLTMAAQSTNAEANVLIENPEPEFYNDVISYFNYYFEKAPVLKSKDLSNYYIFRPKTEIRQGYKSDEDELPAPLSRKNVLQNLKVKKLWKISPGRKARYWQEWLEEIDEDGEGFIAMGWDVGDLNEYESHNSLRTAVTEIAETYWNVIYESTTNIGYVTNQLWNFKNNLSEGDIVIVYSRRRIFGIAMITTESEYNYCANENISYEHQVNVKYIWYKEWPGRADKKIIKILGKRGTMRLLVEEGLMEYVLERLS